MDLPQGLTLTSLILVVAAVVAALIGNAFGGWIGLGAAVVVYALIALAGLAAATAVGFNATHQRVRSGLMGTRAALGLTLILGVLAAAFAVFAQAPAFWRLLAAGIALVDGAAFVVGIRGLGVTGVSRGTR